MAISIELRTTCPKCGDPVPVNALVAEVPCPSCEHAVPLSSALWHEVLSEAALAATHDRSGGQTALVAGATLTRWQEAPSCPACGAELSIGGELPAEGPEWIACGCGAGVAVRSLPRPIVTRAEAFFTHLLGEDPALLGVTAPSPPGATPEAVIFPCPNCGGSMPVDAASNRIMKCGGCGSSAYLPDDLWKHLHPVKLPERWYAWVDEARLQQHVTRRATLNRAWNWSTMAITPAFVLLVGLWLFRIDAEVSPRTAFIVSGIGYAGLVVLTAVGERIRGAVLEAAERRASLRKLALVLGTATAIVGSVAYLHTPRRLEAEREHWCAAAMQCCLSNARLRAGCENTMTRNKSLVACKRMYDFYEQDGAAVGLVCSP